MASDRTWAEPVRRDPSKELDRSGIGRGFSWLCSPCDSRGKLQTVIRNILGELVVACLPAEDMC